MKRIALLAVIALSLAGCAVDKSWAGKWNALSRHERQLYAGGFAMGVVSAYQVADLTWIEGIDQAKIDELADMVTAYYRHKPFADNDLNKAFVFELKTLEVNAITAGWPGAPPPTAARP